MTQQDAYYKDYYKEAYLSFLAGKFVIYLIKITK
jgi:hypothetical protein